MTPVKIDIKGDIISNDSTWIYDWLEWDYTSPGKIQKALSDANGRNVEFQINSPGGDVFAGYEIYNMIKSYEGGTTSNIVGLAASCASFIPMASDRVISQLMAMMMIHGASTSTRGNKYNHEHTRDFLSKVDNTIVKAYTSRNGKTDQEMLDLMANETWFTAEEMLEMGLIDEIVGQEGNKPALKAYNTADDTQKRELIDKLISLGSVENVQKAILSGQINLNQTVVNSATIDYKKNPKEGKSMTIEELKAQYPDLCKQLAKDAATEATNKERVRVKDVLSLQKAGINNLVKQGLEDGLTKGEVACNILAAQEKLTVETAAAIQDDIENSNVNNVPSANTPVNQDAEEEKSALDGVKNFMNKLGGRK